MGTRYNLNHLLLSYLLHPCQQFDREVKKKILDLGHWEHKYYLIKHKNTEGRVVLVKGILPGENKSVAANGRFLSINILFVEYDEKYT